MTAPLLSRYQIVLGAPSQFWRVSPMVWQRKLMRLTRTTGVCACL